LEFKEINIIYRAKPKSIEDPINSTHKKNTIIIPAPEEYPDIFPSPIPYQY
jgi:hypothetical protein